MFFGGGDPFEHFAGMHGGPGGPGGMRGGPRKDVDTTALYDTLGVSLSFRSAWSGGHGPQTWHCTVGISTGSREQKFDRDRRRISGPIRENGNGTERKGGGRHPPICWRSGGAGSWRFRTGIFAAGARFRVFPYRRGGQTYFLVEGRDMRRRIIPAPYPTAGLNFSPPPPSSPTLQTDPQRRRRKGDQEGVPQAGREAPSRQGRR